MKNEPYCVSIAALWLAVSIAIAGVVGAQGAQQPPAAVAVAEVVQRQVTAGRTFVGTVFPRRKSTVGSAVEGRIEIYPVNEGDRVAKGQPLAQLLTDTIQIELAASQQELKLRQAELDELKNGALPEEITQSKAELARAEALMDYAVARRRRTEALFQQNRTASQEEFEESVSVADAAQQNYLAAKAAHDLIVKGPRAERIAQAEARTAVQHQQVRLIESRIAKYTIRAPYDGYVSAEYTEVGAWVDKADPIAEVIDLETVEIDVAVPEQYVAHLRVGMTATIMLNALPDMILEGEISGIVPQADIRSRTFPVKVRIANPRREGRHLLKAGMLARVALTVGQQKQVLLVPKDALVLGGTSPRVIALANDAQNKRTTARIVRVEVGPAYGSYFQVSGSLQAGEHVVVQGNERLRDGQPLRVAKVVANQPTPPSR